MHLGLRENKFWLTEADFALIKRCSYLKILQPWKINRAFGVSLMQE